MSGRTRSGGTADYAGWRRLGEGYAVRAALAGMNHGFTRIDTDRIELPVRLRTAKKDAKGIGLVPGSV